MNTIFSKPTLFIGLLLAFAATSHAQEEATPPTPPIVVPAPIVPLEPQVENPEEMVGLIVLIDDTALQVLDRLEKMTGKIILRRQDLKATKINFNSRGPLTKGETVLALESLLSLNGIMLTDMGGRFMKAVNATSVNTHVPMMLFGSTLDLPPSQQIYAKLFTFDYLQVEETSGTTITPLLSQNSSLILFKKSNAILITDALINLQRIERIANEMDKPQKIREEIKFIKLNYIQASEMQQRIENLIQGPLKSYLEGNTSVAADERTNQLILITHPGNLDVIMDVIEHVDVDAAPLTASEVFPLRQAKAVDVVAIINDIISGQKEGREEDAKVAKGNQTAQKKADTPNLPTATPATATTAIATSGSASNSSLQFSNFVGLSADERTNAIVAYGTHSDLETLRDLIDKIDITLPQVRIEVIITEVTLTENQASGLSSFSLSFDDTIDFDAIDAITRGTGPLTLGLDSLSAASQIGNFALSTVLDLAESDDTVKILSTPIIVVNHNEEGKINVSQSRPFETGTVTNTNSEAVTNQIEYRDVGIQLTVTPLIGADGSVTMQIEQTVDTIFSESTTNTNTNDDETTSSVDTNPIIGKREANSTITVKDGQVIILGGLQENKRNINRTIFPILGHIPYLGDALNGTKVEYTRTELILFVRPTILKTPDEATSMSEQLLDILEEGKQVREYLKNGSVGQIYMEGSNNQKEFEKQLLETEAMHSEADTEKEEPKQRPFIRFGSY
jgi:general secretion pathway protein D